MFSDSTIDSTERSFAFWTVKGHHDLTGDLALEKVDLPLQSLQHPLHVRCRSRLHHQGSHSLGIPCPSKPVSLIYGGLPIIECDKGSYHTLTRKTQTVSRSPNLGIAPRGVRISVLATLISVYDKYAK